MTRSLLHVPRYTHKLGIDADESDSELSLADYIVARLPELGEANADGGPKPAAHSMTTTAPVLASISIRGISFASVAIVASMATSNDSRFSGTKRNNHDQRNTLDAVTS